MTVRLILVRHGESIGNVMGRYQGQMDVPLSAEGRVQAERVAHRLATERIDAIYASDLSRARDTAEIIGQRLGMPVMGVSGLREIDLGTWQGLTYEQVRRRHFDESGPLPCYPVDVPPPGGESLRDVQTRATIAVEEIVRSHPRGTLVIVTHGACLKALFCRPLGVDVSDYGRFRFDPGSISEWIWKSGRAVVLSVNDTSHLVETMVGMRTGVET
ncbi:MAG: histidine phosphatase family protein [Nitrospirae bacterium]|nr:histidine phosphatase family protein [Nitrospirota bacterium]